MLTGALLVLTTGVVFLTSVLSGVLGMGGGLILMAYLAAVLPVPLAMSVHGLVQAAANGSRFLLLARHVHLRSLPPFLLGIGLATLAFSLAVLTTRSWLIFVLLGSLPFLPTRLLARFSPDISKPWHGLAAGFLVTLMQLLAGASGPLLDMFYQNAPLTRHQVIATKAATQTIGHGVKIAYYLPLLAAGPGAETGILLAAALIGTWGGTILLERMKEETFKRWFRIGVRIAGALCIARGVSGALPL